MFSNVVRNWMKGENRIGSVGGRTTKFLPVIGAVVVAPNPGWSVCGWWWLSSIVPYSPRATFTIFQPFSGISPKSPLLIIIILRLKSAQYTLYLHFPWLLVFECNVPVAFYCLIARTLDILNLLGTFLGEIFGKIWWFCGRESKLCAMLRPAGSLLCGQSRLLLTADPDPRILQSVET